MNVLETHGLAVGFGGKGAGRTLVRGIEVSVAPGQTAALLGPNGAGKSTLLRTIAGLLPPKAGTVILLNESMESYSPHELAKRRAFMSSFRGEPMEMTVWESAALGRHPHTDWAGRMRIRDRQAVEAALESVGLFDFRDRRLADLSDGERQKATIARALAQEPQLLILDEPTAFLDALRREELMALLRRLAEEKNWACVVTTHELDLALRFADDVWLLPMGGPLAVRKAAETSKADAMKMAFASVLGEPGASATGAVREHSTGQKNFDSSGR
jgi:iron complex transport system ATP-binding protein